MSQEDRRALLLQLAAMSQEIAAAVTMVTALLAVPAEEPLWDAKRTAELLGTSDEWVRDHGAALGIEADLDDGMHRYAPERVRTLRESRKRDTLARR